MNVSGSLQQMIANTATQVGDTVTIAVLKKANEVQAQGVAALVQSAVANVVL